MRRPRLPQEAQLWSRGNQEGLFLRATRGGRHGQCLREEEHGCKLPQAGGAPLKDEHQSGFVSQKRQGECNGFLQREMFPQRLLAVPGIRC